MEAIQTKNFLTRVREPVGGILLLAFSCKKLVLIWIYQDMSRYGEDHDRGYGGDRDRGGSGGVGSRWGGGGGGDGGNRWGGVGGGSGESLEETEVVEAV